jgi:magnesium chelatase family protein
LAATQDGWPAVAVPVDNPAEASLVDGIEVLGVRTLEPVALVDRQHSATRVPERAPPSHRGPTPDLADVIG